MPRSAGSADSGWGRTGPDSLADFTDVIWINTTSRERELRRSETIARPVAQGRAQRTDHGNA